MTATARTCRIEKFKNGFNQDRFRVVTWWTSQPQKGMTNAYVKVFETRSGARALAKREGLTVIK